MFRVPVARGQRAAPPGFTSPKSLPDFQRVFPDEGVAPAPEGVPKRVHLSLQPSLLADERLQCCAGDRDAGEGTDLRRTVRWGVDSPGGGPCAAARD